MSMRWKDAYSVNVVEIDNQHKKLFEIGSQLFSLAAVKDFDQYDEMIRILGELKSYTVQHFAYEDGLMQQVGYPDFETHHQEHVKLIADITRMEMTDLDHDQQDSLMKLITFVADWISAHILKSDMQYKPLMNQMGVY